METKTEYHSRERLWMIRVSQFVANAGAHLARNAGRRSAAGMDEGDWLAYRILNASSELVNVEALFYQ